MDNNKLYYVHIPDVYNQGDNVLTGNIPKLYYQSQSSNFFGG